MYFDCGLLVHSRTMPRSILTPLLGMSECLHKWRRWCAPGPEARPLFWKQRSSRGYILTVVCFAVFTDVFLYGIIVPVVPFSLSQRVGIESGGQSLESSSTGQLCGFG